MRHLTWTLIGLAAACVSGNAADLNLGGRTTLVFATAATGRDLLSARDAFVQRLSAFDRAARLHVSEAVSEEAFLRHVAASVEEWTESDRARVAAGWEEARHALEALKLPWPAIIQLVATNGSEEGGAAYTRGTAIVLPPGERAKPPRELAHLLTHELFHVLSRHEVALRDRLYAAIGFQPCGELEFPAALRDRKITNPDTPELRHSIAITVRGRSVRAIPILFSGAEHYDPARGGEFFDYLQLKLLLVEPGAPGGRTVPLTEAGEPQLVEITAARGFLEQVGRNTQYIIHPEEILADNFAMLVLGAEGLPSPGITAQMREILAGASSP